MGESVINYCEGKILWPIRPRFYIVDVTNEGYFIDVTSWTRKPLAITRLSYLKHIFIYNLSEVRSTTALHARLAWLVKWGAGLKRIIWELILLCVGMNLPQQTHKLYSKLFECFCLVFIFTAVSMISKRGLPWLLLMECCTLYWITLLEI